MNLKEQLSPDGILPLLQAKEQELQSIIATANKNLSKAPAGRIKISTHHGGPQWIRVLDGAESSDETEYIPLAQEFLARKLAQKAYDQNVLKIATSQLSKVSLFLKQYAPEKLKAAFENLTPMRRALVEPVCLPDDEFVERWLGVKYAGLRFRGEVPVLLTARGERVRSKSEVIIADTLYRMGVPYRYEFPYKLKLPRKVEPAFDIWDDVFECKNQNAQMMTVHPDFTCLNVRTRQEFIWEHFGLVEDVGYGKTMVSKMELYAKNGFLPGIKLITTSETQDKPLDSELVQLYVEKYLR